MVIALLLTCKANSKFYDIMISSTGIFINLMFTYKARTVFIIA